jgi:dTDP-4-amino-4,6-dideoxygalactose transaminase
MHRPGSAQHLVCLEKGGVMTGTLTLQPKPTRFPAGRPRLPPRERLMPYLEQIDAQRLYSNFGPLLHLFQERLADHWRPAAVAAVSNATTGLTLALQAAVDGRRGQVAMPAWTHPASVCAVLAAGLTPCFIDVSRQSWTIEIPALLDLLHHRPGQIAAVMAVAPFGTLADARPWDDITRSTGIPVVIDGADSFDNVRPGASPVVVSFHATKAFGIGEGGAVIACDTDLIARVRVLANFGFDEKRSIAVAGLNGKLNEYSAAIGLARLDDWPHDRDANLAVQHGFLNRLASLGTVSAFGAERGAMVRSTVPMTFRQPIVGAMIEALARRGVEARQSWGKGCHRQEAFTAYSAAALADTDWLGERMVCLPFHQDMTEADVGTIVGRLQDAIDEIDLPDRRTRHRSPTHRTPHAGP